MFCKLYFNALSSIVKIFVYFFIYEQTETIFNLRKSLFFNNHLTTVKFILNIKVLVNTRHHFSKIRRGTLFTLKIPLKYIDKARKTDIIGGIHPITSS